MKTKVKFKKGKNFIEFDDAQSEIALSLLKSTTYVWPILRSEVESIKQAAEKEWPVRMAKYGRSLGSKNQFVTGYRIIPPSRIEAFVANNAPYAWAIRSGRGSDTSVPFGRRIAEELLWKPAKKRAKKLAMNISKKSVSKIRKAVK